MPRPWRLRYAGAKYHLTVRGNARQQVFFGAEDYERFLSQLDAALAADAVRLYAYVLMPNHVHLLVETPHGNVHRFMQRLNTAYGMYFRFKHNRPGHCFQGRYGARLVSGDDYLVRVTRYIHLNPIRVRKMAKASTAEQVARLNGFRWSSYRGYAGLAAPEERVDYRRLQLMGRKSLRGNRVAYRGYVESLVKAACNDELLRTALESSPYALGNAQFLARLQEEQHAARVNHARSGDIQWATSQGVAVERVLTTVAQAYRTTVDGLCRHGRAAGECKRVAVELCCRLSGLSQRAVATRFGYRHESAVGKQRQLLRQLCADDPALGQRMEKIAVTILKA
jgi:REP element-mobilizing transposase RayT